MTPEQIELVKRSFAKVVPIKETAAALFYGRLFEVDPALRALFRDTDMVEQGRKLMATLGFVVMNLGHPGSVVPAAQGLARRHVGYGVREEHYATVGAALIWTLRQGLGEAFTPAVEDAWTAAYAMLSGAMIEAAREVGVQAA
ncbi:globin family protein [Roseomonas sp. CCTCC AB2023176]|uniref:globin family protein n=1 Tax=Roseomonas sp. CCTCC AB2023176 TaxID=3342640 RepID=UPI0035E248E4